MIRINKLQRAQTTAIFGVETLPLRLKEPVQQRLLLLVHDVVKKVHPLLDVQFILPVGLYHLT